MLTRKQRWRRVRAVKSYRTGFGDSLVNNHNVGPPFFLPQRRRAASDSVVSMPSLGFESDDSIDASNPINKADNEDAGSSSSPIRPRSRSLDAWSSPWPAFLNFFTGQRRGGNPISKDSRNGGVADEESYLHSHNRIWAARAKTLTEGFPLRATSGATRCSAVGSSRCKGRVRFHQQIRVVLVPSRGEMRSFKEDVWWGEHDYCFFRREYLIATQKQTSIEKELARRNRHSARTGEKDEIADIAEDDDVNGGDNESRQSDDASLTSTSPPPPPPPSPASESEHSPGLSIDPAETTEPAEGVLFCGTDDVQTRGSLAVGLAKESYAGTPDELISVAQATAQAAFSGAQGGGSCPNREGSERITEGNAATFRANNEATVLPPIIATSSKVSPSDSVAEINSRADVTEDPALRLAERDSSNGPVPSRSELECSRRNPARLAEEAGAAGGLVGARSALGNRCEPGELEGYFASSRSEGGDNRENVSGHVTLEGENDSGALTEPEAPSTDGPGDADDFWLSRQSGGRDVDGGMTVGRSSREESDTELPVPDTWHRCRDTLSRQQTASISEPLKMKRRADNAVGVDGSQQNGQPDDFFPSYMAIDTNGTTQTGRRDEAVQSNEPRCRGAPREESVNAGHQESEAAVSKPLTPQEAIGDGDAAGGGAGREMNTINKTRHTSPVSARWKALMEGVYAVETNGVGGVVGLGFPWRAPNAVPSPKDIRGSGGPAEPTRVGSPMILITGGRPRSVRDTPLPCLGSSPIRRVASF